MKTTHPIKPEATWHVVRTLRDRFGDPTYLEELAIYLRDTEDFKVALTRDYMEWAWNDDTGTQPGLYGKVRQRFVMDPDSVKSKLLFLARHKQNTGHISVVSMLRFHDGRSHIAFDVRPDTSVGPNVAITVPPAISEDPALLARHEAFVDSHLRPHFAGSLRDKTSALMPKLEEYVDFDTSARGLLNSKILEFCKRNGIAQIKDNNTYRSVLHAKNNDYSFLDRLFEELTGVTLLSREHHCNVPVGDNCRLSVIVPCYNAGDTIGRTLASLASQELPADYGASLEVVLVDDGSTQPVRDVVDTGSYPFPVEVITLSHNHGVSHARRVGVTHSSGDFLLFLDADVLLSSHYVADHAARNSVIGNAVFVSFKENVASEDARISEQAVASGLALPRYQQDLRVHKHVRPGATGNHAVMREQDISILEDSNYFKDFGGRVFGVYDLSCMITGHNFSMRRSTVEAIDPFIRDFRDRGWGMEDVVLGLKALAYGCFIIPVLSAGVFHVDHPVRSGSEDRKQAEYEANTALVDVILDTPIGSL